MLSKLAQVSEFLGVKVTIYSIKVFATSQLQ